MGQSPSPPYPSNQDAAKVFTLNFQPDCFCFCLTKSVDEHLNSMLSSCWSDILPTSTKLAAQIDRGCRVGWPQLWQTLVGLCIWFGWLVLRLAVGLGERWLLDSGTHFQERNWIWQHIGTVDWLIDLFIDWCCCFNIRSRLQSAWWKFASRLISELRWAKTAEMNFWITSSHLETPSSGVPSPSSTTCLSLSLVFFHVLCAAYDLQSAIVLLASDRFCRTHRSYQSRTVVFRTSRMFMFVHCLVIVRLILNPISWHFRDQILHLVTWGSLDPGRSIWWKMWIQILY